MRESSDYLINIKIIDKRTNQKLVSYSIDLAKFKQKKIMEHIMEKFD